MRLISIPTTVPREGSKRDVPRKRLHLIALIRGISMFPDKSLFLCRGKILCNHLSDKFLEAGSRYPSKLGLGSRSISQQGFDFGRPEVARIHGHDNLALMVMRTRFDSASFPEQIGRASCRERV